MKPNYKERKLLVQILRLRIFFTNQSTLNFDTQELFSIVFSGIGLLITKLNKIPKPKIADLWKQLPIIFNCIISSLLCKVNLLKRSNKKYHKVKFK